MQPHKWFHSPSSWNWKLEMFTMVATLRETRKHSDWPSLAKIAPHLHKVEKISTRIAWIALHRFPKSTTQVICLAPLKMNGKLVVASLALLQWTRTVTPLWHAALLNNIGFHGQNIITPSPTWDPPAYKTNPPKKSREMNTFSKSLKKLYYYVIHVVDSYLL